MTAVLVWRRSNILLGSQEQTCQVKLCFCFILFYFFPYVNCTEGTGGLAFFSGRFKWQLFFSDAISLALRARMFQRAEEWGWASRKHRFNITVCPCLLQPPPLSRTELLFQLHGCEKKKKRKKTAWSFFFLHVGNRAN